MRRDCNIILSHKIKLSYIMNKFTYILFVFLCLISCAQPNNKKQVLKDRGCDITKKKCDRKNNFLWFFQKVRVRLMFSTETHFVSVENYIWRLWLWRDRLDLSYQQEWLDIYKFQRFYNRRAKNNVKGWYNDAYCYLKGLWFGNIYEIFIQNRQAFLDIISDRWLF